MNYLENHCWCSNSHWDNDNYNCQVVVTLSCYEEDYKEDWNSLIAEKSYFDEEAADEFCERIKQSWEERNKPYDQKALNDYRECVGNKTIHVLKPEVVEWLEANVPDTKEGIKGWCVGSDEYVASGSGLSYTVFFQRAIDATSFIERWSKWKKPIHYIQYFDDIRKVLNTETGIYKYL